VDREIAGEQLRVVAQQRGAEPRTALEVEQRLALSDDLERRATPFAEIDAVAQCRHPTTNSNPAER
jgi:hypothetical protein